MSENTTVARSVDAPSGTRGTTRNTTGCTQGRSRTAARCAGRGSVSRATWRCTCATTRGRSRSAAVIVAKVLVTQVIWRNTSGLICEGAAFYTSCLAHVARCFYIYYAMDIWGWIVKRLPDCKLKAETISYLLWAFLWKSAERIAILFWKFVASRMEE